MDASDFSAGSVRIPESLVASMRDQRAILFLGAGASKEARDRSGTSAPNSAQLRSQLAKKFFEADMQDQDLMSVAEMAIAAHGQSVVFEYIKSILDQFNPSEAHKLIFSFRWRMIATTNYDLLVERAHTLCTEPLQTPVPFVRDSEPIEDRLQRTREPVVLLKLHGSLDHVHDPSLPLILSHEHYDRYADGRSHLFSRIRNQAHESAIVFCGYALGDAHIRSLIYKLVAPNASRPTYYMVSPNVSEVVEQFWAAKNVVVIRATFGAFMNALDHAIPKAARSMKVRSNVISNPIRKFFISNTPESRVLAESLDRDFVLLRADLQSAPQDPKQFYEGYDTGWGSIIQRLDADRRLTEALLFQSVLEETSDTAARLFVVRGSAGSGKTVILKRAAWETGASLEGLSLWLEAGGALNPEAIAELYSLSSRRIFIFVDRVALHVEKVHTLMRVAKQRNIPITVIAAERHSEWNTYCNSLESAFHPTFLDLRPLSPGEIEGLLELLERHKCLGLLEGKSREEQIKEFFDRAERQLLVALHETTRGKPFEDIVFEEYNDIIPDRARSLYLDICTLNQFAVPVRAGTISRMSGVHFSEFKGTLHASLDDVVLTSTDPYTGDPQYKARHSRVAHLVFKQACSDDEEKVKQIVKILSGMDIGYSVDKRALDRLMRGRGLTESLATATAGRKIFEAALVAAPNEPFLLQQWAVFEANHPQGSLKFAEEKIRQARQLDRRNKSVIHTQAEIARKRALQEASPVAKEQFRKQARERLSEIGASNDVYVVSSRCKLCVDELADAVANSSTVDAEADDLSEKFDFAEATLARALQLFPDDSDLNQQEARLAQLLQNNHRAIGALQKAWAGKPKGCGIAIQLSRAFISRGEPDRAFAILEEALDRHPDDKNAHFAMAKLMIELRSDMKNRIEEHLVRSYSGGDSNFDARYLHAEFLFSIRKVQEAARLFVEIDQRAPTEFRIKPPRHADAVTRALPRFTGSILKGHSGESFLFIRTAAYVDDIYCHASAAKIEDWERFTTGVEVSFSVSFSRKGPCAVDVQRAIAGV